MTPLPGLAGSELVGWRLTRARFAATWDSGEGAYQFGGRWNSPGVRAVYCSVDPATAILEIAVHTGFHVLDAVEHVFTSFTIAEPASVHIISPADIENRDWLRPGIPHPAQQTFGDALLAIHPIIAISSVVSVHSWNLILNPDAAQDGYRVISQESFVLDPRLHPSP